MSNYGWERGTVILPRAAIVPMRRAIIAKNNQVADDGLTLAKKAWAAATPKQKRSNTEMFDLVMKTGGRSSYTFGHVYYDHTDASMRAAEILDVHVGGTTPRAPQKKNARRLGAAATQFEAGGELFVTFDTNTGQMTWEVQDGNHSVDRAHESWLAKTVLGELDKVKWTRGTGGYITGNDEYNQDSDDYGAGANYVTSAFGPIGLAEHPERTKPFTKSDGTRVTSEDLSEAFQKRWALPPGRGRAGGGQGRVGRGVSTGGQFTGRQNSAPRSHLG